MALDGLGFRVGDLEDKPALRQRRSNLRAATTRLVYRLFPDLAALALKVNAGTLRFTRIPELFSRDLRQISPSSNEELLDLYGRSEQTLANRLSFFNLSENFGPEIDWERHASPGWRAELHAFDYALDLALTYRISREERYARHLRYLLAQWISANPLRQGSGWKRRTMARRIRNWILAADVARDDWEQDPTFLSLVTESLALQTTYLSQQIEPESPSPANLDCVQALNLAGRFFAGTEAVELATLSIKLLNDAPEYQLRSGESQSPAPPSGQLRLAATLMDLILFAPPSDEQLRDWLKPKLLENLRALEGMLLPDGTLPLFGPAAEPAPDKLSNLYAAAAVIFEEPCWKNLAGDFGVLPYLLLGEKGRTCFESLPNRPWRFDSQPGPKHGIVSLAGGNQSKLLINALPPIAHGGHQDFLSYELYMAGQRVIVDSGAFSPEGETWNRYFSSPLAHNILLVDDQGPGRFSSDSWGISYWPESLPNPLRLRTESLGFKSHGLDHARVWYCLDGQYWVVLDRLQGAGIHRCTSLVHFYPTFSVELRDDRVSVRSRSLALTLIPLGPDAGLSIFRGSHGEFPSWYAPDFGLKYESAALRLEWGSAQPPWIGGFLLIPGTADDLGAVHVNPAACIVCFELFGKPYRLEIS